MKGKPRPADAYRFLQAPGTTEFLGERGKRERRRILLDPASQVVNALIVRHGAQCSVGRTACAPDTRRRIGYGSTSTDFDTVFMFPASSVTVSVTL